MTGNEAAFDMDGRDLENRVRLGYLRYHFTRCIHRVAVEAQSQAQERSEHNLRTMPSLPKRTIC